MLRQICKKMKKMLLILRATIHNIQVQFKNLLFLRLNTFAVVTSFFIFSDLVKVVHTFQDYYLTLRAMQVGIKKSLVRQKHASGISRQQNSGKNAFKKKW